MLEQDLPEPILSATKKVSGVLARLDATAASLLSDLSVTKELSAAAQELGRAFRACALGPEKAIVHCRHLMRHRPDGSREQQRQEEWLASSLDWVLDGYYREVE